eukprot:10923925-Alexandrium_andersonii.AAC.1
MAGLQPMMLQRYLGVRRSGLPRLVIAAGPNDEERVAVTHWLLPWPEGPGGFASLLGCLRPE